ncbi:MAG: excalibur calcium-binding domain-containing protein [Propionicimonas sp.]|uniref:excalibur calcium-binding domain-containing protein n=1 Tax=Propionicimonas sp. TaxID=1955623 RepID=UPI002B2213CC|nr:excalibur calcium-binding domain-containing protein [Propionicimonas sp.]MEA4944377.1 excalibur calcium-binding domain-containing protein [Propionicimonas sp.]MEA5116680.1 excalibur calcium-binding domain-containing protein [Propionicimonas sp.]
MFSPLKLAAAAVTLGLVAALAPLADVAPEPVVTSPVPAAAATADQPTTVVTLAAKKYQNCKALNKKYKHGVGKKNARDKVRGRTKPVTNFKRDNVLYQRNKHLDRDRDGVACEKR